MVEREGGHSVSYSCVQRQWWHDGVWVNGVGKMVRCDGGSKATVGVRECGDFVMG